MQNHAETVIDVLGGTTAVAKLIEAPVSTVHSWRKIGIPPSRLAHLKLAAHAAGKRVDWDSVLTAAPPAEQSADETAKAQAA